MTIDWRHYRLRAFLALIIVGGFLAFVLIKSEAERSTGAEIILETRPIDPRDTFFGNYAILSYDIERGRPEGYDDLLSPELSNQVKRVAQSLAQSEYSKALDHPVFVLFELDGYFHRPMMIVNDEATARSLSNTFLRAELFVERSYGCTPEEPDQLDCRRVALHFDLPGRYYADPETALALQNLITAEARLIAEHREFERCEEALAEMRDDEPTPAPCDNVQAPAEAAPVFGVILAVSQQGDAVIKGVFTNGRKFIDSLTGPRITQADL